MRKNFNRRILIIGIILGSMFVMGALVQWQDSGISDGECLLLVTEESPDQNTNQLPRLSTQFTNVRLYMTGINQTHTRRGNNFTMTGYVQQYESGVGWENQPGLMVFPVIDGNPYNGSDGRANLTVFSQGGANEGEFEISFQVPHDQSALVNMSVHANITATEDIHVTHATNRTNPLTHDITGRSQILIEFLYPTAQPPLFLNDSFQTRVTLTDELGNTLPNMGPLNLSYNGFEELNQTFSVGGGGQSTRDCVAFEGIESVNLNFSGYKAPGKDYFQYTPSMNSSLVPRVEGFNLEMSYENLVNTSDSRLYFDGEIRMTGSITHNDTEATPLVNRGLEIFLNGVSLANRTTDENGNFTRTVDLAALNLEPGDTLNITVLVKRFDPSFKTQSDFTQSAFVDVVVRPPRPAQDVGVDPVEEELNYWRLVPVILGVAAAMVGIVILQRKRMEWAEKRAQEEIRLHEIMGPVTILYFSDRMREAIAYTYFIFKNIVGKRFKLKSTRGQTMREFAMLLVNKYGQDPLRVYPFISIVEEVVYGQKSFGYGQSFQDTFVKTIEHFRRLYWNMTGQVLGYDIPDKSVDSFQSSFELPEGYASKELKGIDFDFSRIPGADLEEFD